MTTRPREAYNPDFPITAAQAHEAGEQMRTNPIPMDRPLLVLAGWHQAWPFPITLTSKPLGRMLSAEPDQLLALEYATSCHIPPIATRAARRARERWSSGGAPAEVDVVTISMGGLVARLAAARGDLMIRRLYTIVAPHKGARMASSIVLDRASCAMRPGSAFLARLDAALADATYELVCYARLNDVIVGAKQTAPEGMHPYWLSGPRFLSHIRSCGDMRILADIARRMRHEEPFAQRATPPPMD